MADYKEILQKKAEELKKLLLRYQEKINEEERNEITILIDNTFEITNGRLDGFDYQQRDETIMTYHSKLDHAIQKLSRFKEVKEEQRGEECI